MMKTKSLTVRGQRCHVKLEVGDGRTRLMITTPENRLSLERTQLEAVHSLLSSAYGFELTFPELRSRLREPMRTTALHLVNHAQRELIDQRIHGGDQP